MEIAASSWVRLRRHRTQDAPPAKPRAPRGPRTLEHNILITATLCLLAGGLVMVYSASSPSLLRSGGSGTSGLIRFAVFSAVGLLTMRFLARRGLEVVRRYTGTLLGVAFVLLLAVRVPGLGHAANGSARWIGAGPFQFEPSELMKLALVLYGAHVLSSGRPSALRMRVTVRRLMIVGSCACMLVFTTRDLGTSLVMAFTVLAMLWSAGVPVRTLAMIAVAAVVVVGVYASVEPYAAARLSSFLDPWHYASQAGFQAVHGQIAIGSGGLFGRGPGAGVAKDGYLPEASTDFILAVIGEEFGAVGIVALLALYALIAFAGVRVSYQAKARYPALIAIGITSLILIQASLNVFAVLGLAPITGVPLPFISYGASNLLVLLAGVGLLLNVASGGTGHLSAVRSTRAAKPRRSAGGERRDRDRDGWDGGARRAGARRRGGVGAARR
jgi:cell division protein FtsW